MAGLALTMLLYFGGEPDVVASCIRASGRRSSPSLSGATRSAFATCASRRTTRLARNSAARSSDGESGIAARSGRLDRTNSAAAHAQRAFPPVLDRTRPHATARSLPASNLRQGRSRGRRAGIRGRNHGEVNMTRPWHGREREVPAGPARQTVSPAERRWRWLAFRARGGDCRLRRIDAAEGRLRLVNSALERRKQRVRWAS